jgi:hypothetical protein
MGVDRWRTKTTGSFHWSFAELVYSADSTREVKPLSVGIALNLGSEENRSSSVCRRMLI